MNFINLESEFENNSYDFCGEEAKLYIVGNNLYKLYNKKNISSIYQLCLLISKQSFLKETILPNGIILKDDTLKGICIPYFKDYKILSSLNDESIDYKLKILQIIMKNLKELTDNDIYPMDFNSDGILINNSDVKIIDLDTYTTQIIKDDQKKKLKFVLNLYRNIILELMYQDFEPITVLPHLNVYLESKNVNKKIIYDIDSNISYHNLSNFIESMKK